MTKPIVLHVGPYLGWDQELLDQAFHMPKLVLRRIWRGMIRADIWVRDGC